MKKFVLHLTTDWCGTNEDYAIVSGESLEEVENANIEYFDELARNNYEQYDFLDSEMQNLGIIPDEDGNYTEEEMKTYYEEIKTNPPYSWYIEEVDDNSDYEKLEL